MNSHLAILALLLWILLLFLVFLQCRKWAKASLREKIICQNHPAIPVKEYKLSDFERSDKQAEEIKSKPISQLKHTKLSFEKQKERLEALKHSWDI